MSTGLSTRWETRQLITALRAAGWGSLDGREWQGVRSVLDGLVARLPFRSGQGMTTVDQVRAAAGLSERWTRRCLTILEEIGLIEWNRGGVVSGRPQPSWFRIIKRRLVELIEEARPERAAAIAHRRALTAARLAGLRKLTVKPRRLKPHAALNVNPDTPKGVGLSRCPAPERDTDMKAPGPIKFDPYRLPVSCKHGALEPSSCPSCKLAARTPEQIAEDEAYEMTINPTAGRTRASAETIARGIALCRAALAGESIG